jgi:uncharacterized protein YkwD
MNTAKFSRNSRRAWRNGVFALVLAAALNWHPAMAQDSGELVRLVNAYRSAPRGCEGKPGAPAGPLSPAAVLTQVRVAANGGLQAALKARGYAAAQAQAITLAGPTNAAAAMRFIEQRYCSVLLNPRYAEIGVARDGRTWRIVLARPVLSAELGEWTEAGKEILKLTNAARATPRSCGDWQFGAAPPVARAANLGAAALAHSRDMASRNFFEHRGTDGSQVGDRAARAGYRWRRVGENIATGQGSPGQAVSAWLCSPSHCANMMNPAFTELGAAYAVNASSDTTIYWTQVLGTPR